MSSGTGTFMTGMRETPQPVHDLLIWNERAIVPYFVGAAAVVVAIAAEVFLRAHADFASVVFLYLFPVMITAWFGGFLPGLFATALSLMALTLSAQIPGQLENPSASLPARMVLFLLACLMVSGLSGLLHVYRRRLIERVVSEKKSRDAAEAARIQANEALFRLQTARGDLRRTDVQMKTIIEAMPEFGAWLYGPKGQPIYMSRSFLKLLGMDEEEAGYLGWAKRVLPEQREGFVRKWRECLERGVGWDDEVEIEAADGTIYTIFCEGRPVREPTGELIGWVGVKLDVTARRQAEAALRKSELQFKRIVDANLLGVFQIDGSGRITFANDKFLEMLAVTRDDVRLGRLLWNKIARASENEAMVSTQFVHGSDVRDPIQIECQAADGRLVPVLFGATVGDADHDTVAFVLDLSEQKRIEAELVAAKERAESADRAKSIFLANMSHEIRTPLGAIIGFAELLLDENQSKETRDANLETIIKNGRHLTRIINDILDLSKIDSEAFRVTQQEFSLRELMEDLRALLGTQALEKSLELRILVETELPERIRSDAGRIKQVLVNIIGNAIKFTQNGRVEIRIRGNPIEGEDGRRWQLEWLIDDTGIGIRPEERERLFKAFAQAQPSIARMYGGTGLGLHLSRKLAQALGGELVLTKSECGKGSQFCFSIPVEVTTGDRFKDLSGGIHQTSSQRRLTKDRKLQGRKILVVDDSPDLKKLIHHFLTASGAEVDLASNGLEGIRAALTNHYHAVVMDIEMPVCNGYEAIRRLRAEDYLGPVIALTAHAMRGEKEHSLNAGFNDYLVKPIDRDALIHSLATLIDRPSKYASETSHPPH